MKSPLLYALVCLLLGGVSGHAAQPEASGLLRLAGGDYLPGNLADSTEDSENSTFNRFAWRHPDFASPLDFSLQSVIVASFPPPEQSLPGKGMFAIGLERGDRLFGDIIDADEKTIRVVTDQFGELSIRRSAVRRISRWNDGESVLFSGPGTVEDWKILPDQAAWHSGGNQLHTDQPAAMAFRDIHLPDAMRIEAELTWEGKPNFVFAIGVDSKNSDYGSDSAFHVEVWDDQIALVRELDEIADCVPIGKWKDLNGSLRLTIELDQVEGRMVALSPQAEVLGEITVTGDGFPGVRPGVRLTNIEGNVSLESLRVMKLTSRMTREIAGNHDFVLLNDQIAESGDWSGVVDGQWVFTDGDSQRLIDPQNIQSIDLRSMQANVDDTAPAADPSAHGETTGAGDQSVQVVTHGGVRLNGTIESSQDGRLKLVNDVIAEAIELPHAEISRITGSDPRGVSAESSAYILGRLEFSGGRLTGRLVDTDGESQPTPLRFAPRNAAPVNLAPNFSGRMVYRETPPPETATQRRVREQREAALQRANQRRANQGGVWNVLARAFGNNSANQHTEPSPRSMHLRSGEIIPCEVKSIDENNVMFTSDVTEKTKLPQEQIRAIAFTAGCRDPEIEATRRDRLLTVPRIRKKNPPTHLIVAVNGDIMRGRLVGANEDTIEVETRLERIAIKRSVVAQIIWLDDRSDNGDEKGENDAESDAPPIDIAVRAILRNGNRMSLIVRGLENSILTGNHPLLGESNIKLGDVNELRIGVDINDAGADQPYGDWQLTDAPEPIIESDGAEGGTAAMSPLVGKEAPDFSLEMLAGGKFSISESRGKIIVLDFWATWCGPCMQAMPVIEDTVAQFDESDVRLVAVNLQETTESILETLERINVAPEVALDIDGVAAARYHADAIPQTVIIDRDGTITHVFVGGGPRLGEQLHAAIAEAILQKQ